MLAGATALQGNNVLRFNTAAGDIGRFYLQGFDRTVRNLSSAGAGSAIIANAPGSSTANGARPANLIVNQDQDGTYKGTIVDTSLNDNWISGTAGALGLVKKGNATLTLTGGSSYTGGTKIEAGTLRVKGAAVCAAVRGIPFEPCFNVDRTDPVSFRGSVSGMSFAYCDFTHRSIRRRPSVHTTWRPRTPAAQPLAIHAAAATTAGN
jgi:autotransporter-associated beta strand protein